jgi:hypothetical protein
MKPLSQQILFQELPSPQAKKLLENVTTCDDGKENSCTTFLRRRIKFSTKHTSSLDFPGILQGHCTSNKRFSPPKPCNKCENFIKNGEENTDLSSLQVVLISKQKSLLELIAMQLDFFREQQTQLRETNELSLYTLLQEHAASELARLGPRFCNKTTRARRMGPRFRS